MTNASNSSLVFVNSKMDYPASDSLLVKISETIHSIQRLEIMRNLPEIHQIGTTLRTQQKPLEFYKFLTLRTVT